MRFDRLTMLVQFALRAIEGHMLQRPFNREGLGVRDRRRAKAVGTRPPAGYRGFPSQPGIAFQRARQTALRARTPRPSVRAGFGLPATPYRRSGTSLRSKPATYPRRPPNSRGRQDNPYRPVSFRSPVKQRGRRSCALAPAARHMSKPHANSDRLDVMELLHDPRWRAPPARAHLVGRHPRFFRAIPTRWRAATRFWRPPPGPPVRLNGLSGHPLLLRRTPSNTRTAPLSSARPARKRPPAKAGIKRFAGKKKSAGEGTG
jgi:hypothetical protein